MTRGYGALGARGGVRGEDGVVLVLEWVPMSAGYNVIT